MCKPEINKGPIEEVAMLGFNLRQLLAAFGFATILLYGLGAGLTCSLSLETAPAAAKEGGNVPGNWSGNVGDAEFWRAVRKGGQGTISIPDKKAATLVQSDGEEFRALRNGPLSQIGVWMLLASVIVISLFFAIRGKIRVESGMSGQTIERFNDFERAVHWLTASSFMVLAVTGLNILYGKYFLPALIGQSAFSTLTMYGKSAHNYIAFSFIIGIGLMFVMWVKDNIFDKYDLKWLAVAGGFFSRGLHPPARRFNFGQKSIFWAVMIGGGSLVLSGLSLLFPFEIPLFAGTFTILNFLGFDLPTDLTALQETQLAVLWHSLMALVMTSIIIAHIYIGSLGMEGAICAVSTGKVDLNWAREHHNLWVEEVESEGDNKAANQPAE